ncbi:low molecular weight protein tyrosine phosphatase family protein [Paraburkholderia hospita]|uniref:low molecular weight protein tyrosine phosphatase family protein n=1 Tax=Paraburkholderia hospita TaxID=169430 RepID=UPI000B34648E|nr:low molecular weight protein tyrosine phosphatase family protein [Paraburkholderia hospita]OUL82872.1 phosphotyrosine protein phosphatase [Paraburkholderia hospita]
MRALFICSRNRLRSPTAEALFSSWPGVETDSAGLAPDAAMIISMEQVLWADMIFVMERAHKARLSKRFGTSLKSKQIICLDIPDKYTFMQPELIAILERTAGNYLRRNQH